MKSSASFRLWISAFWLLLPNASVHGQCYYPNGDPSKSDDQPCSSNGHSACCPLNWECLSNGLCYLENEGYFGRYTCTDQSWQSEGCPNICTQGALESSMNRTSSELNSSQIRPPPVMKQYSNAAKEAIVAMPIVLQWAVAKPRMTSSLCLTEP